LDSLLGISFSSNPFIKSFKLANFFEGCLGLELWLLFEIALSFWLWLLCVVRYNCVFFCWYYWFDCL